MYVSLSSDLKKFEWYEYRGRRIISFEDHHPEYDLDIEPKAIFGVRKLRGKNKLILLEDPKILFTLSDTELSKVLRVSAGHSERRGTVELAAGTKGGKSKPQARVANTGKKALAYDFPMPPTKQDIMRAYNYFNKKYFKNECPKITIEFPRASKYLGQAQALYVGNQVKFVLKISKKAMTDTWTLTNLVLHEMIHLLHYKRAFVDNDKRYSGAAHGPLFIEEMHRLNKLGYSIDIKENDVVEVEMEKPVFVLAVYLKDQVIIVFNDTDFSQHLQAVLKSIRKSVATSVEFDRYVYGTTQSNHVFRFGAKLTARKTVPKSQLNKAWKKNSKIVASMEKTLKVKEEKTLSTPKGMDVRKEVHNACDAASDFIEESYDNYILAVMMLAGLVDDNIRRSDIENTSRQVLSTGERTYVQQRWNGIEDHHVLEGEPFKQVRRQLLKHRLDGEKAAKYLGVGYSKDFQGRIDNLRYAKLCVKAFGDIITMADDDLEKAVLKHIP